MIQFKHFILGGAIGWIALSCSSPAPTEAPTPPEVLVLSEWEGFTMGSTYSIACVASDTVNYRFEVDSILTLINTSMSIYDDSSIISLLNTGTTEQKIDDHFSQVFQLSQNIYSATEGSFDPAVLPLVNAWGFGFEGRLNMDSLKVASLRASSSFEAFTLDTSKNPPSVVKTLPTAALDFGGIAKGYAVDAIALFLQSKGVDDFLIEIGGELRAMGENELYEPWSIGIYEPSFEDDFEPVLTGVYDLHNKGMATSGSYRNFYEENGIRYAHILDPATGFPVKHNLLSVTVIAPTCAEADAYATAFMVMGEEASMVCLEKTAHLEALFISSDSTGKLSQSFSQGMKEGLLLPE